MHSGEDRRLIQAGGDREPVHRKYHAADAGEHSQYDNRAERRLGDERILKTTYMLVYAGILHRLGYLLPETDADSDAPRDNEDERDDKKHFEELFEISLHYTGLQLCHSSNLLGFDTPSIKQEVKLNLI